jgi:hypothetical protein
MNKENSTKILVALLLLTWAFAGYHIFVQMPKMLKSSTDGS